MEAVVFAGAEAYGPKGEEVLKNKEAKIIWIGHSTFLLLGEGISVLTDPWLGSSFFMRRRQIPALTPERILSWSASCRVVLVSHCHGDHFDRQGVELARMMGSTVIGPPSVLKGIAGEGLSGKVARAGDELTVDGFSVEVVPADHPAPGAGDAVGYVFQMGGKSIYFAGDTLYSRKLVSALKKYRLDVAILPIGAFKIFGKKVVMDTSDAVKLAKELKPGAVFPMHYDFLKGTKAQPELLLPLRGEGIAVRILTPGAIYLL